MDNLSENIEEASTKTILVVEDDQNIRELLEFTLKREGFQVVLAANGQQALQAIGQNKPDIVLMDLMMPGTSGFDLLRMLQSDGTRVKVVVITGRFTDKANEAMIRQEANVIEFLAKPIKPASLAFFLHRTLKTRPPELKRQTGGPWPTV